LHLAEPVPGDVWRWPVVVRPLSGKRNPGGFDLELWLWEQGVRVVGQLDAKAAAPLLLQPAGWGATGWMERWRSACRARIQAHVTDARVAGLIRGLTIGEQGALSVFDWDALRTTGTAHLASISGLHVTMMGAMLSGLVGALWRCSPRLMRWWPVPVAAGVGGLLGATLYAWMAGWGLPAQRTVWMLGVVVVLRLTGRRWPWPLTLLLAAVVVTALDPWALMAPGFWLSFVAVGVLMWGGADVLVVPGSSRWVVIRHAVRELGRTQTLATVGLAPLSMVFFQAFSVIGLAANLWCIPLFTLLLTPLALLGLGMTPAWRLLEPLARWTLDGLNWASAWPWSVWQVPAVSTWAAALAVLAGAWVLAPVPWRWRLLAVPACLPLLWSTSASRQLPMPEVGEFDVMAADVGQGTAVLVRTARHALLFDTGPQSGPEHDAGRQVLIGMLRATGVSQLDVLMLSHGDRDHIGGAASILRALPVHSLQSSLAPDHPLLRAVDRGRRPPPHQPCVAGQSWQWEGVWFQVLHPFEAGGEGDEGSDEASRRKALGDNARSCVLRVSTHGRQVLLTGDIEADQEAALLAHEGAAGLNSEVLLVPHHGSRTSSTPDFLAAVQPRVAVVQVAARNAYGHPHPQVMARYQSLGIPTVTSPDCGAWWWSSVGDVNQRSAQGRCWRDRSVRYWQTPRPDVHHLGP
jgi:competence protein ComEC